jgi:phosphatidate cytidylyltransferase
MLSTRLWMGAVLVVVAVAVLVIDQWLTPYYPFLLLTIFALGVLACKEMVELLGTARRLPVWLCYASVLGLVVINGAAQILAALYPGLVSPWSWLAGGVVAVLLATFLVEMAKFQGPNDAVTRMALVWWLTGYLGFLPCFLVNLRWLGVVHGPQRGAVALALAMFVPKCCDIGAYFTGRFLGKHRMTPVLSPKKTWEGAAGGLVTAVIAAIGIDQFGPALAGGRLSEIGFGLTVGVAGMLGDLAESLIKRDCQRKDASQAVPGFGGVLDVVDSVVFAAPVAWAWLA